jgi:hypothetical protein
MQWKSDRLVDNNLTINDGVIHLISSTLQPFPSADQPLRIAMLLDRTSAAFYDTQT